MTHAPANDLPLPFLLARGVARALAQRGYATLTEVSLANGRRADVMGLGRGGELVIVEVKSSLQDFRSDAKWREYREFCDRFYFAVSACCCQSRRGTSVTSSFTARFSTNYTP